jgi:hypothetical protein
MTDESAKEQLDMAIDALERAYNDAVAAITAMPVAQQAFNGATRLADLLRELAEAAPALRAREARRIWEEEQVSLATLAGRIGVSKARAGQLINAAKPPSTPKE